MNKNKTVLITGSNKGIGRAIAYKLAEEGYSLTLHCRSNIEELRSIADDIHIKFGTTIHLLQFDVANRAQCKKVLDQYVAEHTAPYGVVSNAGISLDNVFPAMLEEEWDSVLSTNLGSFYNVLHPLVMPMVSSRKPGRIITMSSISGIAGNRGQVNYSASKAGIIGATKSLAIELAKRNITVNCVAPGLIDTEMVSTEALDSVLKAIPAQRMGKPEEVAATVAFLMSEGAAYITRQVISVNGGML
jgi:3-oxoacyl-[acyl-carrier protein] reductase